MELGLLYQFDVPQPWAGEHPWGQRTAERQAYRECIEQIVHADRMGFHTVWCVEHHFRENRSHMPCNEAVLGALSQITKDIRLGFGVTLAPHEFIHPARLAEKVAAVDLLSRGRVEWGIGRSTPMEQAAFKVDRARSKEKMRAAALVPALIDLLDPKADLNRLINAITAAVEARGLQTVVLIVIDTTSRTFGGGDENTSDMAAYVGNVGRLQAALGGCAAMLVHHRLKNSENETPRGHGSLWGACDTIIIIEAGSAAARQPGSRQTASGHGIYDEL